MQCQNCQQHAATIHLTEIANGERFETHLCEDCAQQQGLTVKSQIPLNELLSSLLSVQSQPKGDKDNMLDSGDSSVSCPQCGMNLQEFSKNSLLGCSHDYETFAEQLDPLIERTQAGNSTHCGKVPSKASEQTRNQVQIADLRRQLEQAVTSENYEAAAKLRDQIKQLE